jgi:hypothetical protein
MGGHASVIRAQGADPDALWSGTPPSLRYVYPRGSGDPPRSALAVYSTLAGPHFEGYASCWGPLIIRDC